MGFALMFGGASGIANLGGVAPLNHEFSLHLFGKAFGHIRPIGASA